MLLIEIVLATVAYHVPFSSEANNPLTLCSDGVKIEPVDGKTWTVDGQYDKVIVKAGAGVYANTVFLRPAPGVDVYADTNGNFRFDPTGPGGDKDISHVIVCPKQGGTSSPSPSPSSPSASPSTTPSASITPTSTPTPTPEPSVTASRGATESPDKADDPALAETGSNPIGTAAAGIALALTGWALTRFRRPA